VVIQISPRDPAVIPIDIIIPNSNNPCNPDGTVIKVLVKKVLTGIEINVSCNRRYKNYLRHLR